MSDLVNRDAVLAILSDMIGFARPDVLVDAIGAVRELPTASTWYRAEEPPKQYGAFAVACVYDGKLYWYKGIYLDGKWLREGDGIEMPADYWMPLPEPPKEE